MSAASYIKVSPEREGEEEGGRGRGRGRRRGEGERGGRRYHHISPSFHSAFNTTGVLNGWGENPSLASP
jgi:hypothetical protein